MQSCNKIFIIASFYFLGLCVPFLAFATGTVNLGTAENFAILSKTGISNIGAVTINGDIGMSPASTSAITNFEITTNTSNTFSTSAFVNGKIYTADQTASTAATLAAAIKDMEAAYSEASSRPIPSATDRIGGEIGGLTFSPGLYKWNTGVTINSDITLAGGTEDVWVFQIEENLTVGPSVKIIFPNGEQAKNVFWQVAGKTILGTNVIFAGNILNKGTITMKTGAVMNGRALTQTSIALDGNTITRPGFVPQAPTVVPSPIPLAILTAPTTTPVSTTETSVIPMTPSSTLQVKNPDTATPLQVLQSVKPSQRFIKNLFLGSKGSDVSSLQSFLIAKNIGADAKTLATTGVTGYFGSLTKKALIEFQRSAKISPAIGYFGQRTMAHINSI